VRVIVMMTGSWNVHNVLCEVCGRVSRWVRVTIMMTGSWNM